MPGVQQVDSVGGVNVSLSSGEASLAWSSHAMGSLPGSVGFGLQFQASNEAETGVPIGWSLQAASSFPYTRLNQWPDGSVGLIGTNGTVANYREGSGGLFNPVQLGTSDLNTNGLAPVLMKNPDGTFSVTTKSATAVFALDGDTGAGYLSSVSGKDNPMLGQKWSGGRIQSVSDPVSGREITFVYGGGDCPKPASGFSAAPNGMLCQVKFWDGSTSAIFYVDIPGLGASIGRIIDFPEAKGDGARVFDLAYDSAGRIARTRSPLAAAAAASNVIGADDAQFWTEVTYTAEGRVESMTEPASSAGATRCTRTYNYESAQSTLVNDSCFGGQIKSIVFDPTTFFTISATNSAGLELRNEWDFASGQLLSSTDYSGLTTVNRYEGGNLVQSWGPTKGAISNSQTTLREYDESFEEAPDGIAMKGLDVTYWPSESETGANGVQELGPRIGDVLAPTLTVNWEKSPAGNNGGWSGLMTGVLDVKTEGTYKVASGNSIAKVRINNVLCVDGACDALPLGKGANQLRIDLSSATAAASMDVTWSGPDTGGTSQSVPVDALRPAYGYMTTTKVSDPNVVNAVAENVSKSSYLEPATGRVSSRVNQAGSKTTFAYEGGSAGKGGWSRQTSVTSATGAAYTYTYWGDKESAKSACPGAKAANQGGGAKTTSAPGTDGGSGGPTTTKWINASGALVAAQLPGGVLSCTSFGPAGQTLSIELIGMGTTYKSTNNFAVGGNPLIMETTETIGDVSATTRTEMDLLGRSVRTVDRYGIETRFVYDVRTGNVASTTITAPGVAPVIASNTYDAKGSLASNAIDGRTVATFTYNPDGTVRSIAYGNGVTMSTAFNDQNRLVNSTWSTPSGRFANSREISAGGNVSSERLEAPAGTSTFSYIHDSNGRLSQAAVTAGLVPTAKSWQWTFDDASNRLTQKVTTNGAVSGDFTYAYNKASQLVSTTDPAAAGGITYDAQGNALTVGPDSFTYDKANNVITATDGTVTVAYERDFAGSVIAKTTTGGPSAGTIRYSSTGVLLDADSKPYALTYSLDGGVSVTKALVPGAASRWQFTGINGDLFFTTDDAGTVQGSAQAFDPFGQVLTTPIAPQPTLPATTWEAGTGNETESLATPYQLMGARVYIPALGRFAQLDPKVGGSANGYDYVNQDPVNFSDPTGNETENWLITGLTGLAAFAVGALVAPARGAVVGVLVGAIAGAAVAGLSHAIEYAITGQTEFSAARLGISILAGAVGGGIVGRVKWARAQNNTVDDTASSSVDLFDDLPDASTQYAMRQGSPSQSAASGLAQRQAVSASFKESSRMSQQGGTKLIVGESDVAGIRLMRSKSVGAESGAFLRAAQLARSSGSSSYSLRPSVRVSQQLDSLGDAGYVRDFF
jgi:RHS repeat-associated protein